MTQKIYLWILKAGIYLSFLAPFLVFKQWFFPYITSKQIYFNILIEILFIFWIAFIVKYSEWRPKKSLISFGLMAFFMAMLISCFTGVDFHLSFWGDAERMLGFFHLFHFLIYYFIIITVFRSRKDWRNLFIASITASTLICLYALIKTINYSTIGNTAYVSGYAIFNIYFALILFFQSLRDKDSRKNLTIGLYPVAIIIMISVFRLTYTRGAYVGLGASIFVMLILFIAFNKSKKIKIYCFSALAVIAILVSLVFINADSSIVKNSSILNTITQINAQAVTFQTRLIAWKTAVKDFPNHPIFGTGNGNFAVTFDKYFDPTFYDYTRQETYFDRAHNNIVDIASTTGIVGILTYLSIFIAVGYYLIKGLRRGNINYVEFILLTSLIIAYFIQNLAVFDSLVTYISLMITLGFIYWISLPLQTGQSRGEFKMTDDSPLDNKEIFNIAIFGVIMLIVIFQFNIKPAKALVGTIKGQIAFNNNDVAGAVEAYKDALKNNTVMDRDSRDILVRTFVSEAYLFNNIEKEKLNEMFDFVINMAEKNIAYNSNDSLMQMQFAKILDIASRFNSDNQGKFYFYSDRALEAIDKSIEASPGRIPIYFHKAQIYATRGENDKAIETLKYAVSLNEKYYDSYCNLAKFYFYFKDEENGFINMDKCLDLGGEDLLAPADYVSSLIGHYGQKEDWPRTIPLYERLANLSQNDAQVWVDLAKLYVQTNNIEKAIKAAKKSAEIDSSLRFDVDIFIKEISK